MSGHLSSQLLDLCEVRSRVLNLLDLFDEARLIGLAPAVRLQSLLQLFDSFLKFGFLIVDWMDVLSLFFELTIDILHALVDGLNLIELVLLLIGVGLELAEELSKTLTNRILAQLVLALGCAQLGLLSYERLELFLQGLDLFVDASHIEMILGIVRLH